MHHHWPQDFGGNNEQECGPMSQAFAVHHAVDLPIEDIHYIQSWPRFEHSGLVIPEKP